MSVAIYAMDGRFSRLHCSTHSYSYTVEIARIQETAAHPELWCIGCGGIPRQEPSPIPQVERLESNPGDIATLHGMLGCWVMYQGFKGYLNRVEIRSNHEKSSWEADIQYYNNRRTFVGDFRSIPTLVEFHRSRFDRDFEP